MVNKMTAVAAFWLKFVSLNRKVYTSKFDILLELPFFDKFRHLCFIFFLDFAL